MATHKQGQNMRVAASHPGKMGDALYALPTLRRISRELDCKIDFYTSKLCESLRNVFLYQTYVENFYIPDSYRIERMDMGVQPWRMPVPKDKYDLVYELGFRNVPDRPLHEFIGRQVGINVDPPLYDYPDYKYMEDRQGEYYVLHPRGRNDYTSLFRQFIEISDKPVIQIGGADEYMGKAKLQTDLDRTGLDFLETLYIISKSAGFVGLMSSQLVLANGFNIPKIVPHDGKSWDMRHVIYTPSHHYLVWPTAEEMLEILQRSNYKMRTFSKTLNTRDYDVIGETAHVANINHLLSDAQRRFEHEHRAWEYGLALKVLRENDVKSVLDVGGGGSVFAPAAAWIGIESTQVDPGDCANWVEQQKSILAGSIQYTDMNYVQEDFFKYKSKKKYDAVTCLSVIEHVEDFTEFFLKLLSFVKTEGLLILTTDFHPSGQKQVDGHLKTFNADGLNKLVGLAESEGFEVLGNKTDYDFFEPNVNNYTFASLVLRKKPLKTQKRTRKTSRRKTSRS